MGQISLGIPQSGQSFGTEGPKVATDMTTIQTVINGNLDSTNISNTLAQSAAVNTGTQTVKGAVNIAASESRSNVAYGTLTTPDQVTGIVLPANGLIAVWYQATWQESVSGAASADIFLGSNELKSALVPGATAPAVHPASIGPGNAANSNYVLTSFWGGLASAQAVTTGIGTGGYGGDVTTGQTVGGGWISSLQEFWPGGPCYIFAAAGTYTVGVQFKASSGSVTASNRKLWVQALSFA